MLYIIMYSCAMYTSSCRGGGGLVVDDDFVAVSMIPFNLALHLLVE